METAIIIVLLALFSVLAVKRLDWAAMLLIAALPSYLVRFKAGVPFTFLEMMIFITAAVWLFKGKAANLKGLFKKDKFRRPYPFRWEIILIILVSWSGIIVAGFSNEALGIWKAYFFEPILLFLLLFDIFPGEDGRKKVIASLAVSAIVVSAFAIYQEITGQFISNPFWAAAATRRAVSFFGYPNAVGLFLGPLVMIFTGSLFAIWKNKGKEAGISKAVLIAAIVLSLAAIVCAQSEGAVFGLAGAAFIFGLVSNKKLRLVTISAALLFAITIGAYQPLRHYVVEKVTLEDLSGQIRQQQWKETMMMLKDGRLLTGAGLSGYQAAVKPFHQEGIFVKNDDPQYQRKIVWNAEFRKQMWQPVEIYMYPHNIFLNFWTEIGLLGALLFAWLIIHFFIVAAKCLKGDGRYLALGLIGAMGVIVINGLVDVPYFKNDLSAMFWIFMFLVGSLSLTTRKK